MQSKWKNPLPQLRLGISLWHRISSSIGKNIQDLAETLRNPLSRIGVFCRAFFIYHSQTTGPSQSIFTVLSSYFIRQTAKENEQMHGPGSSGGNPALLPHNIILPAEFPLLSMPATLDPSLMIYEF